jgi:uncharacterized protein (TIGR02246 family)
MTCSRRVLLACAGWGAVCAAQPGEPDSNGEDCAEIRSVIDRLAEADNRSDPSGAANLFAGDAEVWSGSGLVAAGPTAIGQLFSSASSRHPKVWSEVTPARYRITRIRALAPGIVLVHVNRVVYGSMVVKQTTRSVLVLRKEQTGWMIVSYWTSLPAP